MQESRSNGEALMVGDVQGLKRDGGCIRAPRFPLPRCCSSNAEPEGRGKDFVTQQHQGVTGRAGKQSGGSAGHGQRRCHAGEGCSAQAAA